MSIVHVGMFGFKPLATPEEIEEVSGLFDQNATLTDSQMMYGFNTRPATVCWT